jgi:hypothetical protein
MSNSQDEAEESEKHLRAESFRQTVMWNNAALASLLEEEFVSDPSLTREAFYSVVEKDGIMCKNEIVEAVFDVIDEKRSQVGREIRRISEFLRCSVSDLQDDLVNNGPLAQKAGEFLYKDIVGEPAQGEIAMRSNGLSLSLDFATTSSRLIMREALLGRSSHGDEFTSADYIPSLAGFIYCAKDSSGHEFPLMIFPQDDDDLRRVRDHEWGHLVNHIIMDVLKNGGHSSQWGGVSMKTVRRAKSNLEEYLYLLWLTTSGEKVEIDEENIIRKAKDLEGVVLPYVFAQAKDELLADFQAIGTTRDYQELLFSFEAYENIKKFLYGKDGKVKDDVLEIMRNYFSERYRDIGSMACNAANEFQTVHIFSRDNLTNPLADTESVKNKVFPYLLAQVPLEEWSNFLKPYFLARLELTGALQDVLPYANEIGHGEFWKKFSAEVNNVGCSVDLLSDYEIARILRGIATGNP